MVSEMKKENTSIIESKTMGGTLYHGTYLDFVKWCQEKDPNWEPTWTGNQVKFEYFSLRTYPN